MSYTALYREWRPQSFSQVVGQEHVVRTLTNAIRDGQLSHAYLFAGPRGTGKTSIARILAKAINCEQGPTAEPCAQCISCTSIADGTAMDVMEIDAASNRGINEIRDLREKVRYAPAHSRHKVYIIDEVHMLTTEAFNALLKTLEDPPGHVFFLMATTEAHKIPLTILSRLQRFDFHRLKTADIVARLREICEHHSVETDDATLHTIARQADGALRDALGLLDQCRSFSGSRVTVEDVAEVLGTVSSEVFLDLASKLREGDLGGCLAVVDRAESEGRDLAVMTRDFLAHFRNLMLLSLSTGSVLEVGDEILEKLRRQTSEFSPGQILHVIDILADIESRMRFNPQPRLLLEVALMKLVLGPVPEEEKPDPRPAARAVSRQGAAKEPPAARETTAARDQVAAAAEAVRAERTDGGFTAQPAERPRSEKPATTCDRDQEVWSRFRDKVRSVRRGLHALLEPGRLVEVDANRFVVGFPGQYTFHKERTEESASLLNKILSEVTGRECRIVCIDVDGEGEEADQDWPQPEPEPDEASRAVNLSPVQAALDMFNGELVDDRDRGGR